MARTGGSSRRRTATSGDDESQCRAGPNEAIAHVVSSRRSTTPNAPLKADRQEASVPLRADGSPVWAFRSPGLRIAAPARLPEAFHLSGVCRTGAPRSQLRDSSGFAPDSLGTRRKLNASQGAVRVLCGPTPTKRSHGCHEREQLGAARRKRSLLVVGWS